MPNTVVYGTGYSAAAPSEAYAYRTRVGYVGDGTKTGIIACHGGGGTAGDAAYVGASNVSFAKIQMFLADCGWPVITADLGGDPIANDTGTVRVGEARTWIQASPRSAKSGKVIVAGWSEGGAIAMKYALDFPGNVAALILLQPASDLQDIVTNNRGGFASLVNAAYAGGYSDATYGAAHNPKLFASTLATYNIPTWMAWASDDTVTIPAPIAAIAAAFGVNAVTGLISTGNHGDGFMTKLLASDGSSQAMARWLNGLGL